MIHKKCHNFRSMEPCYFTTACLLVSDVVIHGLTWNLVITADRLLKSLSWFSWFSKCYKPIHNPYSNAISQLNRNYRVLLRNLILFYNHNCFFINDWYPFCIQNQIKNDIVAEFFLFFSNIVTIESNINCCWIDCPYSIGLGPIRVGVNKVRESNNFNYNPRDDERLRGQGSK